MTGEISKDVFSPFGIEITFRSVDENTDLGYIVIHSTFAGRSMGGLRMLPDVTLEELRLLARSMTLKYAFLGLPQGGAKAGLRFDPEASQEERRAALRCFAQAAEPLLRAHLYVPNADMGTTYEDIRYLLRSVGLRPNAHDTRHSDSGYYTAHSVLACAREGAASLGFDLAGSSIAIEGFGHVGGALAGLFYEQGAKVVAVSTSAGAIYNAQGLNIPTLLRLQGVYGSKGILEYEGAERLSLPDLLTLPVDILSPCARHHSIHERIAPQVRARLICPGANNPVTPEAERLLCSQGTLVLPDFVTNSGGVLGGTLEFAGCSRTTIETFIRREIGRRMREILCQAEAQNRTPREVAEIWALANRERLYHSAQRHPLWQKALACALALYRQRWIPRMLVAPLAPRYIREGMACG